MGFFEFRDWFYRIVIVLVLCHFGFVGCHGCVAAIGVASDPDRGKTRWEKNPWDTSRSVFDAPRPYEWSK